MTALLAAAPVRAAEQPRLPVPGHQDVNGDGRDDIVFGSGTPFGSEPKMPTRVFTVFGTADRSLVDVGSPGPWGQTIDGLFGILATGDVVGDFNGDGRADIMIVDSGGSVLLPGQASSGSIRAEAVPAALRMRNAAERLGIGDVNGDGLDDLVVKAEHETRGRRDDTIGLVFGSRTPRTLDLAQRQVSVKLKVPVAWRGNRPHVAYHVEGVGDLNGDGIGDLAVGASFYPLRSCRRDASGICDGRVWVLYGRRDWPARVNVTKLGRGGFDVRPRTSARRGGKFFLIAGGAAAGDLDGDGYDDMLVDIDDQSTRAVVWGARHIGRHQRIDTRTSRIRDRFSHGIFPIGDFDGDGRADLLGSPDLGPDEDFPNRFQRTFLMRGRRWTGVRKIAAARERDGFDLYDGAPVFRSADVNGDGLADPLTVPLLIGAPETGFVVFGDRSRHRVNPSKPRFRGFRFGAP